MAIETKIGAYICSGCDIGATVNIEALQKVCQSELKVPICKSHEKLCRPDGVSMIKTDIAAENLNRVVIAACSFRTKPVEFNFGPEILADRVNLREHVAWVTPDRTLATRKAAAILGAAVARVPHQEPLQITQVPHRRGRRSGRRA